MRYFIQADVFGKKKYWEFINGLHSGKGKLKGYSIFDTIEEANATMKRLRTVFHTGITFEVKEEAQLPFIKSQTNKRKSK